MDLKQALLSLDTLDDSLWTSNGDPKIDVLKEMTGSKTLTRQDIINIAPQFNRANPKLEVENIDAEGKVVPEEGRREEEVIVGGVVEEYLSGEPLDPEAYAALIKRATDDELPVLEQIIKEQMDQAEKARNAADQIYKVLKISASITGVVMRQRIPDVDNQTAIQQYIAAQNKAREDRFGVARSVKEMIGKDLTKLDPRSPIDRAMARKTARGVGRPDWKK